MVRKSIFATNKNIWKSNCDFLSYKSYFFTLFWENIFRIAQCEFRIQKIFFWQFQGQIWLFPQKQIVLFSIFQM